MRHKWTLVLFLRSGRLSSWGELFLKNQCVNNGLGALLWLLTSVADDSDNSNRAILQWDKASFLQHYDKWLVWQTEKCQVLPWFAQQCDKCALKTIRVLYNKGLLVRSLVFFGREVASFSDGFTRKRHFNCGLWKCLNPFFRRWLKKFLSPYGDEIHGQKTGSVRNNTLMSLFSSRKLKQRAR